MERITLKLKNWIKNHPVDFWILVIILLVGAFCRLYKIDQYMTFLGDEGRDAIVVRNLLVHADPILIGPGTSIGSMYLGPLYYYFMAPFLFLSNFSPVGPAIGIAVLGVATIFLVYLVTSKWFSSRAGLIASGLYAISPTVIIFSRSSWNPNIMPFFALLSIYSIWKVWKEHRFVWLIILGISMAFVLQSHYLGLLLVPTIGIYYLATVLKLKNNDGLKNIFRYSLFALAAFVFLMSPLVIFDFRHDFMNSKAVYKFFTVRQETVSIKPWNAVPKIPETMQMINTSLLGGRNIVAGNIISVVMLVSLILLIWLFIKNRKSISSSFYLLLMWIGFALIGFGVYKQHIYDHYFGFLFAAPFIFLGGIGEYSIKYFKKVGVLLVVFMVGGLLYFNLANSPLKSEPNRQMQRSEKVAQKIFLESNGKPFNIAVLAERNYEDGYQYFLEKDNAKIIEIDAQIKETVTDQLFVICEMEKTKCDPTHSAKAEVANFGWSKIDNNWEVDGVMIYKLIHSKK